MKLFETEALFYLQIYSEMGEPCKTPEEKYNQLREFFENISKLPQSRIDFTIDHALQQSAPVGEYSGYSRSFWLKVHTENLNFKNNGINK